MSETLEIVNARDLAGEPVSIRLSGGLIDWFGPADEMEPQPGVRRIDAEGRTLLPGFCDSHLHLFWGGVTLNLINLLPIHSREEATAAFRDFAASRPGDGFVNAYSANYDLLGEGTRPDRHALDAILPDRPMLVQAVDGHAAWANTKALRIAGLMDTVPTFEGAEVVIGEDGLPTGELREWAAIDQVMTHTANAGRDLIGMNGDEPSGTVTDEMRERDKERIAAALSACAAYGITTVVNMDGNLYQADLLIEMAEADELPISVGLPMTISPAHDDARVDELIAAAQRPPIGKLTFGVIKLFQDGVFDTWTAYRTDDYPERPGFRSEPLFTPERFNEICCKADAAGLQIEVHCVGDGAVRQTLDGYDAARKANGARDSRHRIEHIDMLNPDDLPRFSALGVIASMQPVHPPGSSGLPLEPTVSIMGRHRWGDTFPWAAMRRTGVPLAFGTDWPTAPLSPFNAIHAALSRKPWADDVPDQRIPFEAVFAAYSAGGAYTVFSEHRQGRLETGMAADVILLDGNPRDLATSAEACSAALTVSGGRIVHDALS